MEVTLDRVREIFDYRHDGCLVWKVSRGAAMKGDKAGTINGYGYCMVWVDGKWYYTHRLIWLWHHGYMPEYDLDHINRIKGDNRVENLREASRSCNMRNMGNRKDNKSGVKGVYGDSSGGRCCASITVNYKTYILGSFDDFDEAVLTRLAAEQCLDWSNCDSSSPAYKYALEHRLIRKEC